MSGLLVEHMNLEKSTAESENCKRAKFDSSIEIVVMLCLVWEPLLFCSGNNFSLSEDIIFLVSSKDLREKRNPS